MGYIIISRADTSNPRVCIHNNKIREYDSIGDAIKSIEFSAPDPLEISDKYAICKTIGSEMESVIGIYKSFLVGIENQFRFMEDAQKEEVESGKKFYGQEFYDGHKFGLESIKDTCTHMIKVYERAIENTKYSNLK